MTVDEINDNTEIFRIYESQDFRRVNDGHAERFRHYLDFLRTNDIPNIWDGTEHYFLGKTPYDRFVKTTDFHQPVQCYSSLDDEHKKKIKKEYKAIRGERKILMEERKENNEQNITAKVEKSTFARECEDKKTGFRLAASNRNHGERRVSSHRLSRGCG